MTDQKAYCVDGEEVSEYGFLTYKYWQWRSRFFISALIWALLLSAVGYCVGYFSAIELILRNACVQEEVKK